MPDYGEEYGKVIDLYDDTHDTGYETDPTKYNTYQNTGAEDAQTLLNSSKSAASGTGFDFNKLLDNLFGAGSKALGYAQNNPLQALLMASLAAKAFSGGNTPQTAGYKGGINMARTATRNPVNVPAWSPYSGKPVYGPTGGGVTYGNRAGAPQGDTYTTMPVDAVYQPAVEPYQRDGGLAAGGVAALAKGRYLRGQTDGMADKLNTSIDGKQPAKLSHGEFVIPADVVSHLGNGNSDAGADVLYKMMDRVRQARTGTKKQGKKINPSKFTPGGGVEDAKYAGGGAVAFEAGGPASGTTTQSNLSEWAGPYVTDYLSKAQALGNLPYQSFSEWSGGTPLTAGESPLQTQAFQGLAGLQMPGQFGTATDFMTRAGLNAGNYSYTPQNVYAPYLQQFQMNQPKDVTGQQAYAAQLGAAPTYYGVEGQGVQAGPSPEMRYARADAAQLGATPMAQAPAWAASFNAPPTVGAERVGAERISALPLQQLRMDPARDIGAPQLGGAPLMSAQQTEYRPDLQTYQMRPAERVTTQGFDTSAAQGLMSPYMQSVVDIQKREAQRQADIARGGRGARYAQAGAFGGARQAIENAEAQRNLATQMGDIQAQGLQSAYQQAQQQFNTQQQQALAAQQANQQAGLTTGQQNLAAALGVQQLGAQTGLQTALANLNNQQQAEVQNQSARLQTQGLSAQQALQVALANQQNQQQANLQNLSAGLQTQGLQAQTGLQAQQSNQQAGLQALLANQQTGLQAQQFNAQQAYNTGLQNAQFQQQAALANQGLAGQYGLQQGQFGQAANLQNAQFQQAANAANQQLAGQYGLASLGNLQQAAMANLQNRQQANLATQQLQGQYGLQQGQFNQAAAMQNPQLAQQAALANQQMGYNVGQQNLNALLGIQSLGAGQNLQAQLANQQAGQFGANLGLQANQQLLGAGQGLAGLGQTQFGTQLQGLQAMLGAGGQQQQTAQQGITALMNEYNKQMMYPYQQLQFQQSMMQGLPVSTYANTANLSPLQQIGQTIGQGAGLWNLFNPTNKVGG
jgi:hypothetical protein